MSGSVIPDNNGRFVIVTGKLYGNLVALVNLYGPNWDNPQFFSGLIGKLPDLNSHLLILGGDFNCMLQPTLDKSSHKVNLFPNGVCYFYRLCNPTNYLIPGDTPIPLPDSFYFSRQFIFLTRELIFI